MRSADVTSRREALQELVQTPGWGLFVQHVLQEWQNVGYVQRMGAALAKDDIEPKVVHRTAQEMLRLLQWPADEIAALEPYSE